MLLLEKGEMGFFPTKLELICGSLEEVGSFIFRISRLELTPKHLYST